MRSFLFAGLGLVLAGCGLIGNSPTAETAKAEPPAATAQTPAPVVGFVPPIPANVSTAAAEPAPAPPAGPSPTPPPTPAPQPAGKPKPPIDTLLVVVDRGIVLTSEGGIQFPMTFKADHTYTFKAPQQLINGTWRIDGDKLCTISTANPMESCTVYPASKKSGDVFDIQSATLGPVKVKIN